MFKKASLGGPYFERYSGFPYVRHLALNVAISRSLVGSGIGLSVCEDGGSRPPLGLQIL